MPSKTWFKKTSLSVAVVAVLSPLVTQCGGGLGGIPGADMVPGAAKCPDMTNYDALADFDWAGNFRDRGGRRREIKSGVIASVEVENFAKAMDADLMTACGGIAKDLGAKGEFKTGEEACKAAAKAIGDVKAKLGANAKLAVDFDAAEVRRVDERLRRAAPASATRPSRARQAKVNVRTRRAHGRVRRAVRGHLRHVQAGAQVRRHLQRQVRRHIKGKCGGKCDGKCDGKPAARP